MTWSVYIVRCADNSLYTGITIDLPRRLHEHNTDNQKGARYTRSRRPVDLVFSQGCQSRSEASQMEYAIKKMSRSQKQLFLQQQPNE